MADITTLFDYPGATLRKARIDDIDVLTPIINHAFAYQDEAKGAPRLDPGQLEKKLEKADFYVVETPTEVIGCFYVQQENKSLHFGLLVAIDSYRKKGLGQAMMKAIEEFARAKELDDLTLDYMSLSPWLQKYYEGYGFKQTGETLDIAWSILIRMKKPL